MSTRSMLDTNFPAGAADRETWRNLAIAFAVTMQVAFVGNTGTIGVAAMILTLGIVGALAWQPLVRHLVQRPLPHIFWMLALLSTLWSIEPALTLRFGTQLALTTFVATLMTGFGDGRGSLQGMALAFLVFLLVSLATGHSVAMGATGGTAFSGLTGSKNLLAGTAALAALTMVAAAQDSFERGRLSHAVFFAGTTVLALYVTLLARSSGALIGLAVAAPLLVAMLASRLTSPAVRSVTLILLLIAVVVLLVFIQPIVSFVTDVALQALNKDPTLTGRVYLWQRADEIIAQRPWLGVGYNAFWVQGHVEAEGLWRWAGITGRMGFNFHNTMRETLVTFGWVGFTILSASLLACVALFARLFVLGATVVQVFWFAVLVEMLTGIGWESFLPTPFNFSSFFILAAFCAACSPASDSSAAARTPYRRNPRVATRPAS